MIRIETDSGEIVRLLKVAGDEEIHFDKTFGFVTQETLKARNHLREKNGLRSSQNKPEFSIRWTLNQELLADSQCRVEKLNQGWKLFAGEQVYKINFINDQAQPLQRSIEERNLRPNKKALVFPLLLAALLFALPFFFPNQEQKTEIAEVPPVAPVVVQMEKPKVVVPQEEPKPVEPQQQKNQALDPNQKVKKALSQNLGFLKLLGRKDLKKAVGGLPTNVPEASAGAGPGGKEGSGGELLTGLGQGLRKTTVGNSGMAGLGGIGTKGVGGGLGGYGETDYGSGAGRSLSTVPLSQDAVMEGGLDRSLIIATIMRYLSQVRACYEDGLKRKADLIGQVTMNFEINGTGALNYSRVQRSSLGDREVEQCISTRMMNWKFPTPKGGVNVKVSYPFMLRPVKS
jgi:hypothetical protein